MGSLDAPLIHRCAAARFVHRSHGQPGIVFTPTHLFAPPVEELVWPVPADPEGVAGPTRGQSRGPGWRCTSRGWFVAATTTDELVEQRILEAFVAAGPDAVVTGWASLRLQRAGYFDG